MTTYMFYLMVGAMTTCDWWQRICSIYVSHNPNNLPRLFTEYWWCITSNGYSPLVKRYGALIEMELLRLLWTHVFSMWSYWDSCSSMCFPWGHIGIRVPQCVLHGVILGFVFLSVFVYHCLSFRNLISSCFSYITTTWRNGQENHERL